MRKRVSALIGLLTMGVAVAALFSPVSEAKQKPQEWPATLDEAITALGSSDPMQRARATCLMGRMRDAAAAAIPHLVKLLSDDAPITDFSCDKKGESWRHNDFTTPGREAAKTMTRMGPEAVEPLIKALKSDNVSARANAAFAMQMVSDPRVFEALSGAVNDEAGEVRKEVVWAMSSKEDPRAVSGLVAALENDPDSAVREKAAWSLGIVGDERSVESLVAALSDPATAVRTQAAWALGITGDQRAVESLGAALDDKSDAVREQAAWALGVIADPRAVEPLLGALDDSSPEVRAQAAWALGIIGDPRAAEALQRIAKDKNQPKAVKKNAGRALEHVAVSQVLVEGTRTLSSEAVLAPGQRLRVEIERGSFRIEAADTDRARAEATVTCFEGRLSCAKILSEVMLISTASGNTTRLEIAVPKKKAAIRQLMFEVVITVPKHAPLSLHLDVGDVTIHGLENDVAVDLGVGSVELEMPRRAVARVRLESDMGTPSLEGRGIDDANIRRRDHEHGEALTWDAGSGAAAVNVAVGVGSISARLF